MTVGTRIAIIIGALEDMCWAATAMYLAFTEVGSDTILGSAVPICLSFISAIIVCHRSE